MFLLQTEIIHNQQFSKENNDLAHINPSPNHTSTPQPLYKFARDDSKDLIGPKYKMSFFGKSLFIKNSP